MNKNIYKGKTGNQIEATGQYFCEANRHWIIDDNAFIGETVSEINPSTLELVSLDLNNEQKKLLIQECKKRVESFKYSLLDLCGCLNDCLKWGDEIFYIEAEENFNVCLRKLKEAKQIIEGIF